MADAIRSEEPHDRLTRMCAAMTDAFEAHPEHRDGDRCIVFLDDHERGGLQLHGYDDDAEAMAAILSHLKALFEANGARLEIHALATGMGEG